MIVNTRVINVLREAVRCELDDALTKERNARNELATAKFGCDEEAIQVALKKAMALSQYSHQINDLFEMLDDLCLSYEEDD